MVKAARIALNDEFSGAACSHDENFNLSTSAPTDSCPAYASAAADSAAAAAEDVSSSVRSSQRRSPNWDPWVDSDVEAVSAETGAAEAYKGSDCRLATKTTILSASNVENFEINVNGNSENNCQINDNGNCENNCQIKNSACDEQIKSLKSRSALNSNVGNIAPITKNYQGAEIIKNNNPSTSNQNNDRGSHHESRTRDLGAATVEDEGNSAWCHPGQQTAPRRPIGFLPLRPPGAAPRPVVIDASNVAISATKGQAFDARALAWVVDAVRKNGHEVHAVVPEIRKRRELPWHMKPTWHQECLRQLSSQGALIWARPRYAREPAYDDYVVLKTAKKLDAAVISNDKYRDWLGHEDDFDLVILNDVQRFSFKRGEFQLDRSESEQKVASRFYTRRPHVQEPRPPLAPCSRLPCLPSLPTKRKLSYTEDELDAKHCRWD